MACNNNCAERGPTYMHSTICHSASRSSQLTPIRLVRTLRWQRATAREAATVTISILLGLQSENNIANYSQAVMRKFVAKNTVRRYNDDKIPRMWFRSVKLSALPMLATIRGYGYLKIMRGIKTLKLRLRADGGHRLRVHTLLYIKAFVLRWVGGLLFTPSWMLGW